MSAAPAPSNLPANMGALTSLRALFAWWVVLFHLAPLAPFNLDQSMPLLHKGPVLVDCFFVLSGFVLFHMYPRLLHGPDKSRTVATFLLARVARLYPVHLAVLAGFVALIGGLHLTTGFHPANEAAFSIAPLGAQLLLLHGFAMPTGEAWNFPSWSISSEVVAYLFAPLLFRAIVDAGGAAWTRALLPVLGLLILALAVTGLETGQIFRFTWAIPRVVLEFTLGAMLRAFAGVAFAQLLRIRTAALCAGWGALLLLAPSSHPGLFFVSILWLILFLSLTPGWTGRLGVAGRYLGESSYAVYMVHALILLLWAGAQSRLRLGDPIACAIAIVLATQACASLLHRFVEKPGRAALRKPRGVVQSTASRDAPAPRQRQSPLRSGSGA